MTFKIIGPFPAKWPNVSTISSLQSKGSPGLRQQLVVIPHPDRYLETLPSGPRSKRTSHITSSNETRSTRSDVETKCSSP